MSPPDERASTGRAGVRRAPPGRGRHSGSSWVRRRDAAGSRPERRAGKRSSTPTAGTARPSERYAAVLRSEWRVALDL